MKDTQMQKRQGPGWHWYEPKAKKKPLKEIKQPKKINRKEIQGGGSDFAKSGNGSGNSWIEEIEAKGDQNGYESGKHGRKRKDISRYSQYGRIPIGENRQKTLQKKHIQPPSQFSPKKPSQPVS